MNFAYLFDYDHHYAVCEIIWNSDARVVCDNVVVNWQDLYLCCSGGGYI